MRSVTPSDRYCASCQTPIPAHAAYCPACGTATPTEVTPGGSAAPTASDVADREELADRRERVQNALGESFTVHELVGQGGFGEVWAASDVRLKREVAVKVIRGDLGGTPQMLARFRREAEAAAKLRHPNIVPIYQVGESEGLAYFIMPLIGGESLRARVQREGALPMDEARRIIAEAGTALEAAHRAGLIHRDIKPENIMLEGEERRALLMDFGIARAAEEGDARLTGTGLAIGTPQYMSPEQASAEKHIDHRADIYSLGVVAYEVLTGRLPFVTESAREQVVLHLTKEPPNPRGVRPEIPEDLAEAVLRCLRKAPEERWATAGELAQAFRPPAAVSVETPVQWMARRLRRSVGKAQRRIRAYLLVTAAVLGTLAVFSRGTLVGAWRYWTSAAYRRALREPPASAGATANSQHWGVPYYGAPMSPGYTSDLASLGDTLLIAWSHWGSPMLFDGRSWTPLPIPPGYLFPPLLFGDSLWVLRPEGERTIGYAVVGMRASARDTIPGRVTAAWGDGSQALLATSHGELLRGRPHHWRREPTGTRAVLGNIFGSRNRQFALGSYASPGIPDSLLVFNGLNWRTVDPRPDTGRYWVYDAGAAEDDGTLLVVGEDCALFQTACRGLVAALPPGEERWRRLGSSMPERKEFYGAMPGTGTDLWLRAAKVGLFQLSSAGIAPVPEFSHVGVTGMAYLRGEPVVLTTDGALWTRRNGAWGVLGELPSAILSGVTAGASCLPYQKWAEPSLSGVRRILIGDIGRLESGQWVLGSDGRVQENVRRCDGASGGLNLPLPRGGAAVDIARFDMHLVAATSAGTIERWSSSWVVGQPTTGSWQSMAVAGGPLRDVVELATGAGSGAAVLTRDVVWRWDSSASRWERWRQLPTAVGRPLHLALASDGSAAVVVGDRGAAVLRDTIPAEVLSLSLVPTCAAVTPDGRIVLGFATAEDPLLGGDLRIFSPLGAWRRDRPLELLYDSAPVAGLPGKMDVYGLAADSNQLYVVGSGGRVLSIRLGYLPYAPDTSRVQRRGRPGS